MFETSQDLLNIFKAAAILGLAVFACWAIYYFVMILRQGFLIIKEMRARINKIDELIKAIKEKIEHSASYLLLISEGVKKLVEVIKERVDSKQKAQKKKK